MEVRNLSSNPNLLYAGLSIHVKGFHVVLIINRTFFPAFSKKFLSCYFSCNVQYYSWVCHKIISSRFEWDCILSCPPANQEEKSWWGEEDESRRNASWSCSNRWNWWLMYAVVSCNTRWILEGIFSFSLELFQPSISKKSWTWGIWSVFWQGKKKSKREQLCIKLCTMVHGYDTCQEMVPSEVWFKIVFFQKRTCPCSELSYIGVFCCRLLISRV